MTHQFQVGDKVEILDVSQILLGDICLENGMITEVIHLYSGNRIAIREKSNDELGLIILADELHAIRKVEQEHKTVLSPVFTALIKDFTLWSVQFYEDEELKHYVFFKTQVPYPEFMDELYAKYEELHNSDQAASFNEYLTEKGIEYYEL